MIDSLFNFSLLICTTLLLIIPGLLTIALLYRGRSWQEIFLRGPSVGFAAAVFIAFALSYIHLALFWFAWALLTLALWASFRGLHLQRPSLARLDVCAGWLMISLCVVFVVRLLPSSWQLLPSGWDPSFHLLLAKKILVTHGMIFDWEPFETSRLNYPVGCHVFLAEYSLLTGVPLHTVFKFLFPVFGAITTAQIYCFAGRVSGQREIALYSAMAYGLLAGVGSVDYYRWGGLPNLIGMSFMLEILIILTGRSLTRKDSVLLGLMFTALCFAHHHVMITAGVVLTVLFGFYWFQVTERARAKIIFEGLLFSLVIGCFYIVPYALRVSSLGDTAVLTFKETMHSPQFVFNSMNEFFSSLVCLGLAAYFTRSLFGADQPKFNPLLLVVAGTLATLFIVCGYIYNAISLALYGQGYTAFTPSRFLADLVYCLAVFAGYAVWRVQRLLPMSAWAGISVAVTMLFVLTYANRGAWNLLYEAKMSYDRYLALDWVSRNTPEKTIVLDQDDPVPYVSWRRTLATPMPTSEPQPKSTRLSSGDIVRLRFSGDESVEARGWELVAVEPRSGKTADNEILWQSGSIVVVRKMGAR